MGIGWFIHEIAADPAQSRAGSLYQSRKIHVLMNFDNHVRSCTQPS
jgi:hypothetical protein